MHGGSGHQEVATGCEAMAVLKGMWRRLQQGGEGCASSSRLEAAARSMQQGTGHASPLPPRAAEPVPGRSRLV